MSTVHKDKVYFAFRKTPPNNPTLFQKIACWVTKARLVSQYCHGGMIVNGDLLHVNTKHGLHKEIDWTPDNWELFEIKADSQNILELFEKYKQAKYDWFSLIAFVGLSISDPDRLYCFEWMWLAITGQNPSFRITPEMLLTLR